MNIHNTYISRYKGIDTILVIFILNKSDDSFTIRDSHITEKKMGIIVDKIAFVIVVLKE